MRKIILLFATLFILAGSYATVSVIGPKEPRLNAAEIFFPVGNSGKQISLLELTQISVKDFETLRGKKLGFFDRIGFKKAQKKVSNQIALDGTFKSKKFEKFFKKGGETGFHFGGFALGFFVGLIGVLIAYLINDDYKRNRVKWAWIGLGITFVLNIILLILILDAYGF